VLPASYFLILLNPTYVPFFCPIFLNFRVRGRKKGRLPLGYKEEKKNMKKEKIEKKTQANEKATKVPSGFLLLCS